MKSLYFYLFATVCLFSACLNTTDKNAGKPVAQAANSGNPSPAVRDSANFTKIEWLDSAKHLGTVKEGEVIKISYRFKNAGNKQLILENVQPSCGCTVADWPRKPFAPGEEGVITAEFDSKGKPGTQRKSISVTANTSEHHTLWFDVLIN